MRARGSPALTPGARPGSSWSGRGGLTRRKAEADATRRHQDRRVRGFDRVVAGGADRDLAGMGLRAGADDQEVDRPAAVLGNAGAESGGEAGGGLPRARI